MHVLLASEHFKESKGIFSCLGQGQLAHGWMGGCNPFAAPPSFPFPFPFPPATGE